MIKVKVGIFEDHAVVNFGDGAYMPNRSEDDELHTLMLDADTAAKVGKALMEIAAHLKGESN